MITSLGLIVDYNLMYRRFLIMDRIHVTNTLILFELQIMKRPRMDRRGLVGIRTQPQKLTRRCEVTAILVLYGLPR